MKLRIRLISGLPVWVEFVSGFCQSATNSLVFRSIATSPNSWQTCTHRRSIPAYPTLGPKYTMCGHSVTVPPRALRFTLQRARMETMNESRTSLVKWERIASSVPNIGSGRWLSRRWTQSSCRQMEIVSKEYSCGQQLKRDSNLSLRLRRSSQPK